MNGDLKVFNDIEELKYYLNIYPQDYKGIIVDKIQEVVTNIFRKNNKMVLDKSDKIGTLVR